MGNATWPCLEKDSLMKVTVSLFKNKILKKLREHFPKIN